MRRSSSDRRVDGGRSACRAGRGERKLRGEISDMADAMGAGVGARFRAGTRVAVLTISENTVKRHLQSIFSKTGARDRLELAVLALNEISTKAA